MVGEPKREAASVGPCAALAVVSGRGEVGIERESDTGIDELVGWKRRPVVTVVTRQVRVTIDPVEVQIAAGDGGK